MRRDTKHLRTVCPTITALVVMRETGTVPLNSGGNNSDGRQGQRTCSRPTLFGMRRSCSECGRKKKRCDGRQPCG
ncbi:unnamed protein product [Ectocarpus sp. 13 AM-2016]